MIKNILTLLRQFDYMVGSEIIDIAKGKNKLPETFSEGYKQLKKELCSSSK